VLQNLFLQHLFFAKERILASSSFSLGVVLCCCFCKACSFLFDVSLFQNDVLFCGKRRVVFNLPFEVENIYGEMRVLSEKVCKFFGQYHFMT